MNRFKEGELIFCFNGAKRVEKLDEQGVPMPAGMALVDFVVEEEARTLLIEVKDPSNSNAPVKEREKYRSKMASTNFLYEELVPKVRDTYTFLHLMERDSKRFLYIVFFGLERFTDEKALLIGFKERLLKRIRCEGKEPWKRQYIYDCIVVDDKGWNEYFPGYEVSREVIPA